MKDLDESEAFANSIFHMYREKQCLNKMEDSATLVLTPQKTWHGGQGVLEL